MLDMDDLLEKTHQLIAADADIRHRLAQHYRFALIDEFQDTDPLQWKIIRALASPDGQMAGDKLFIVGDPKQSIYSFRAADVTVFARVRDAIAEANAAHERESRPFCDNGEVLDASHPQRLGSLVMGENFRTLAQPVAFVNALFPKFMQEVPDEPFQVGYDPLIGCRSADVSEGSVELLLLPPDVNRDSTETVRCEAQLVARRLSHLLQGNDLQVADQDGLRPPEPKDIALLLRRRRNLSAYEDALRACGIPFQVAGGRGFYQRQEIYDLANILRVLCNSGDGIALMGALRSPYFGLSDNALYALTAPDGGRLAEHLGDASWRQRLAPADQEAATDAVARLQHWKGLRDRVPLVELLHTILEDTGAWGFLCYGERGEQAVANVHKLLDLAREFRGPLTDFVVRLDLLTNEEEQEGEALLDADALHILTVHAAKGLEFPIVVVPDLAARFNFQNSTPALIDKKKGLGLRVLDPEQDYKRTSSFVRTLINRNSSRRQRAEEKRLLYVACTRARDHLLLGGALTDKHFAADLDAAADCLGWICGSLELTEADLARGSKAVAGVPSPLPIHTDPNAFPVPETTTHQAEPAFHALDAAPTQPAEPTLDLLSPLDDPQDRPEFAASELVLFAADPDRAPSPVRTGPAAVVSRPSRCTPPPWHALWPASSRRYRSPEQQSRRRPHSPRCRPRRRRYPTHSILSRSVRARFGRPVASLSPIAPSRALADQCGGPHRSALYPLAGARFSTWSSRLHRTRSRWTVGISRLQDRPPREHRRGSTILPTAVGNLRPLLTGPPP